MTGPKGLWPIIALIVVFSLADAPAETGDWPMWRRDPQNSGHSDLIGNMNRTPEILWSYFVGGYADQAVSTDIDGDGADEVVFTSAGKMKAVKHTGETVWETGPMGISGIYGIVDLGLDGIRDVVAFNPSPTIAFVIDLGTGEVLWNYTFASPASGIGRYGVKIEDLHAGYPGPELIVWPSKSEQGFAFGFDNSGAESGELIWTAIAPEARNFPPPIAVADLNLDSVPEVVIATYERLYSFNGETGEQEMYLHSEGINRNYGTLIIENLDEDAYPEIAVLCSNLNEHLWIVDNNGSKLSQIWDEFFEYSYPDDNKEVKVTVDSVSDLDGDGSKEIVFSILDQTGDSRWHTKVWDALTATEELEILDEYLLAVEDLDGDGIDEIITSHQVQRATTYYANTTVRNLASKWQVMLPNIGVVRDHWAPHPAGTNTIANAERLVRSETGYLVYVNGSLGHLAVQNGTPVFTEAIPSGFPVSLNFKGVFNGTGVMASGNDGWFRFFNASGQVVGQVTTGGYLSSMVAADIQGDGRPEVILKDTRNRQVIVDAEGTKLLEIPAGSRRAKFGTDGSLVVWDLNGDGTNEILAGGTDSLLILDPHGNLTNSHQLPSEPYDWMIANVTGDSHWDLFVSSYGSGPHTAYMFCIDGLTGDVIWEKDWGPYAGLVGVMDYDDDGLDDAVVREHFDFYVLIGPTGDRKTGKNICGYHAPVITDIEEDGMTDVVWGGGWGSLPVDYVYVLSNQYGTWRYMRQRWVQLFGGGDSNEIYAKMPAVADIDGDGVKEVGIGNQNGTFHCFDGAKGGLEWDYWVGAVPSDVVSCDIDGDGIAEFIFGTSDGRLVVLGEGVVEWSMDFGDRVGDVVVCDLDGDTRADLLVPVMDGNVYALHIPEGLAWIGTLAGLASRGLRSLDRRSRSFQRTHK